MTSKKLVKVYSVHYNRPEFIRWQVSCLEKFSEDPFEYIVINNAREQSMRDEITLVADALDVPVIHTHSDTPFHLAGKHHADSLNSVWKSHMIQDKGCYVMFMDGDCFLVAPFSVNDYMHGGVTFGGSKQQRDHIYHYLTPVVVMANIDLLPEPEIINWEGIGINNTRLDTGGGLHLYFEKHPEVKAKVKAMHNTWHIKPENNNMHCLPDGIVGKYNPEYHLEFFGNEFLHYCRSSNWDHQPDSHHKAKSEFVAELIANAMQATYSIPNVTARFGEEAKKHNFQIPIDTYFGWGKWSS